MTAAAFWVLELQRLDHTAAAGDLIIVYFYVSFGF
jgi:hypothetical protein